MKDVLYQYRLGREGQSVAPESLIKNRFMLEQVTLNCLTFFSQKNQQMLSILREAINLRLNKMIHLRTQTAFLQEKSQQAKTELQAFLDKVKQTNPDFYNHISTKLVKLLKFVGFSFFGVVNYVNGKKTVFCIFFDSFWFMGIISPDFFFKICIFSTRCRCLFCSI